MREYCVCMHTYYAIRMSGIIRFGGSQFDRNIHTHMYFHTITFLWVAADRERLLEAASIMQRNKSAMENATASRKLGTPSSDMQEVCAGLGVCVCRRLQATCKGCIA